MKPSGNATAGPPAPSEGRGLNGTGMLRPANGAGPPRIPGERRASAAARARRSLQDFGVLGGSLIEGGRDCLAGRGVVEPPPEQGGLGLAPGLAWIQPPVPPKDGGERLVGASPLPRSATAPE